MERSILCWNKCCKPTATEQPRDEWVEELPEKKKKQKKKKKKRVTASISKKKEKNVSVKPSMPSKSSYSETSVQWADLMDGMEQNKTDRSQYDELHCFDTEALSDPKHDNTVFDSVHSDDFFDTDGNTLGDTRISSYIDERDSVYSSLVNSNNRAVADNQSDDRRNSETSTGSVSKRDKLRMAGQKLKGKTKGKLHEFEGKTKGKLHELARKSSDDETRGSTSSEDVFGGFAEDVFGGFEDKLDRFGRKLKDKAKGTLLSIGSSKERSTGRVSSPRPRAITSVAVLSDGYFLIASQTDKTIKMFKTVHGDNSSSVEFVKDFKGHNSGVTALVSLDKKGRFLSAGRDKTVRVWDSRFNCEDYPDEEVGNIPEPKTLLATFDNPDGRWVRSVGVLNEGSFVRPTDDIDRAMLKAVAKKAVLEGTASAQRAASEREILECSGTFVTASKQGHNANIWEMTSAKNKTGRGSNGSSSNEENVAEIDLAHVLTHESPIQALAATQDKVVTGDVIGEVFLWEPKRASLFTRKNWINTRVFSPWKDRRLQTPEQLSKQAVLNLSFLEGDGKFVAGSNNGTIRVWDIHGSKRGDVVHKKNAHSVKVTNGSLSSIQKLSLVEDPGTGEECLAFAVASTDGRVVSMALTTSNSSRRGNELVIFEMEDYSDKGDDLTKTENAINSIAVFEGTNTSSNGKFDDPIIIAGDEKGSIHLSSPCWSLDT